MLNRIQRLRERRTLTLGLFDGASWIVGFFGVALLQVASGYSNAMHLFPATLCGLVCGLAFVATSWRLRLHQGRVAIASFEDALWVGIVWLNFALFFAILAFSALLPVRVSVAATAPVITLLLMLGGRAAFRIARDSALRRETGRTTSRRRRAIVIGAGDAGRQLIESLVTNPGSPWLPVALVDDDPLKKYRIIRGVSVLGRVKELVSVSEHVRADVAILALPSSTPDFVRNVNRLTNAADLELKVLPNVADLVNPAQVQIADVRDIDVTDFLGRRQIQTDLGAIADYITGRRILVTGAGGSIGSELCRQLHTFEPAELIMLDRDESALHSTQLSIQGQALLDGTDTELGDIRDERYMNALLARRKPHVVFHAAALKHLPLLEASPGEAIKTNVWGTLNVLRAAAANQVEQFVNVSTDKAANPCSVLGYSKRVAEGLTSSIAQDATGNYMSVRFGNVLGSRGSVLTAFTAQIAKGGPVTVTDPEVTRYFMTIAEAVQLVIQAGAIGQNGDAMVLDMGEPVTIKSMAERLVELSGRKIDIVYTGLREGEKMSEELFGDGEIDHRPRHPLVSQTRVPTFSTSSAASFDAYGTSEPLVKQLSSACKTMSERLQEHPTSESARALRSTTIA